MGYPADPARHFSWITTHLMMRLGVAKRSRTGMRERACILRCYGKATS